MKTNNKLVKKVVIGVLTFALMLNVGISIKTNEGSYIPEVSLTTMGVKAQDEGWWDSFTDSVGDAYGAITETIGNAWDSGTGYIDSHWDDLWSFVDDYGNMSGSASGQTQGDVQITTPNGTWGIKWNASGEIKVEADGLGGGGN